MDDDKNKLQVAQFVSGILSGIAASFIVIYLWSKFQWDILKSFQDMNIYRPYIARFHPISHHFCWFNCLIHFFSIFLGENIGLSDK